MKTLKLTTLLLVLSLVFGSTSCKYSEGPALSLRSKKARVAGEWIIEKYVDANGNEEVENDSPTYIFDKEGNGNVSFTFNNNQSFVVNFTWEFLDKKKKIFLDFGDGDIETLTILRLKNKEMWLKDSDNEETHFKSK